MRRWSSLGLRRTRVGSMPSCRSRASTAPESCASISPRRTSPCRVFPDHFQTVGDAAGLVFTLAAAAWAMRFLGAKRRQS